MRAYVLFSRWDIIAYLSGGRGRGRWIIDSLWISLRRVGCDQLTQRTVVIKEIAFLAGFESHHGTPVRQCVARKPRAAAAATKLRNETAFSSSFTARNDWKTIFGVIVFHFHFSTRFDIYE